MKSTPTNKLAQAVPWAAVVVLLFLVVRASNTEPAPPTPPTPGPAPTVSAAEAARDVLPRTAAGYATAFNQAAERVASGEIATDRGLLDFLQAETLKARQQAKTEFDAAFEAAMPDGDITDAAAVAEMLRSVAKAWGA